MKTKTGFIRYYQFCSRIGCVGPECVDVVILDGTVDLGNFEEELARFDDRRFLQVGLQIPGDVVQLGEVERGREGQDVVGQAHDGVAQKFGKVLFAAAGFDDLVDPTDNVGFDFLIVDLSSNCYLFLFLTSLN